jgi:hypothetical protein
MQRSPQGNLLRGSIGHEWSLPRNFPDTMGSYAEIAASLGVNTATTLLMRAVTLPPWRPPVAKTTRTYSFFESRTAGLASLTQGERPRGSLDPPPYRAEPRVAQCAPAPGTASRDLVLLGTGNMANRPVPCVESERAAAMSAIVESRHGGGLQAGRPGQGRVPTSNGRRLPDTEAPARGPGSICRCGLRGQC